MPANRYELKDGTRVPGVTTIVNQLDKPQLLDWAWRLGKEGKDWREERDSAGDIGTLVHEAVLKALTGEDKCPTFGDEIILKCFDKFIDWWGDMGFPAIELAEKALISEGLQFGGQPDLVYEYDNKLRLCDIKTSNGIYDSYWYQLAGYDILLKENGYKVDEYQILWLPKDDRFDCPIRTDLRREKRIFKALLEIYKNRHFKEL